MKFLSRLLRGPGSSGPLAPPGGASDRALRDASRRGLLSRALNGTLVGHGMSPTWITGETLAGLTRAKHRGIHLRLVVRQWQPDLGNYLVALQKEILARLCSLDPLADEWLAGISWRFELGDESRCPAASQIPRWQGSAAGASATEAAGPPEQQVLHRVLAPADEAFLARAALGHDGFSPTLPMLPP